MFVSVMYYFEDYNSSNSTSNLNRGPTNLIKESFASIALRQTATTYLEPRFELSNREPLVDFMSRIHSLALKAAFL